MSIIKMYGLFLRHFYLITRSFPRILDLIYWPSIQITLWGFISNFFASHTTYYNNAVGVILTCAILYDFLFRTSMVLTCYSLKKFGAETLQISL